MMKKIFIAIVVLFLISCSSMTKYNENIRLVSMINLISNPERYHKKEIMIKGYYTVQFEEHAIYFSEDGYKIGSSSNAILLDINKDFLKTQNIESPYRGYVLIKGYFYDEDYHGNDDFAGILKNISSIDSIEIRNVTK